MSAIEARFLKGMRATPKTDPDQAVGLAFPTGKREGKTNVRMFRHWAANSEFIRMANDIRLGQLSSADWDVVPADPKKPFPKRLQRELRNRFLEPNPIDEGWEPFIRRVGEDILNLDAGSIELERTYRGEIAQGGLWPIDGGRVHVNRYWDGDETEARYYWMAENGYEEIEKYADNELIYIMQRPATHRSVGLSNLEVLKRSIDHELNGSDYNGRQVTTAGGDGIFNLGENARPEQVEKFQRYWAAEVAGRGSVAFWGGTKGASWIPFGNKNRDMQFMEWMEYLAKKIAGVYGLFPGDLGFGESINKATAQVEDVKGEDRGARPLLRMVSSHLTREIVWDEKFGGRDNNLAFSFTRLNLKETLAQAQIDEINLGKVSSRSVNELRIEKGLAPYPEEHFDWPLAQTSQGFASLRDVPTVRELMENSKKEPPKPGEKPPQGEPGAGDPGDADTE